MLFRSVLLDLCEAVVVAAAVATSASTTCDLSDVAVSLDNSDAIRYQD